MINEQLGQPAISSPFSNCSCMKIANNKIWTIHKHMLTLVISNLSPQGQG